MDLSGAASSFWSGTQRSFRGAVYATALLLMGPLEAAASSVLVDASDGKTLAALEAAGSATIADRGSYRVLSLPNEAARNVASAAGLSPRADFDTLHLERGTLNTKSVRRSSLGNQRRLKLVQFAAPPTDAELDALRATGAEIVQYVPQNAYLVWTTNEPTARALSKRAAGTQTVQYYSDYLPRYALSSQLDAYVTNAKSIEVIVQLVQPTDAKSDLAAIVALADEVLQTPSTAIQDRYWNMRISIPGTNLEALSDIESVVRVEPFVERRLYGERQDRIMSGHLDSLRQEPTGPGHLAWLASKGFSTTPSDYPVLVVVDDGVDNGTTSPDTDEFYALGNGSGTSRMAFSVIPPGSSASGPEGPDGHGHINASIVGGYNNIASSAHEDSAGFNYGLGVSPYSLLANVRIFSPFFDAGTGDATMVNDYYARGARISTNSWGADVGGSYTTDAQLYDSLTRDAQSSVSGNQEMLFLFANGNAGSGSNTVGSPATAKNVISVGASETSNPDAVNGDGCGDTGTDGDKAQDMASFSSRGPSDDGRIKPDIVAPGTFIQGNASQPTFNGSGVCGAAANDGSAPGTDALFPPGSIYTWSSGTSHSTPGVAGYTSLITEFVGREYGISNPSPALVKAYVLHSGTHMTGTGTGEDLPGNNQGFGLTDMGRGFSTVSSRHLVDQSTTFGASGDTITFYGRVVDPGEEVRIALVWTDAPGSTFANAYVNDLDLRVQVGGNTYLGNNFTAGVSQPGGTADFRNNSEAVFLAAGASGTAEITINAITIAGDGVPGNGDSTDQDFALVAYNFSTVISDGTVGFDHALYSCSDTVEVEVADGDLSGAADFDVTVTTSDGDSESVTVSEISSGVGIFRGTISLSSGAVAVGNANLEAGDGSTLTATYNDADDGTGSPASKQATASVDCSAPGISNVASSALTGSTAKISFTTDEAAAGEVLYGTSCGSLSQSTAGIGLPTGHEINLSGLNPSTSYSYSVKATDAAGNAATDDNGGSCYSFVTADQTIYFTENFESNDFDLDGQSLTLNPSGAGATYTGCSQPVTAFPTDPTGGNSLTLGDDAFELVTLGDGQTVTLYGVNYDRFYVGSNGYITFGTSDTDYNESLAEHFTIPRIAGLYNDLNPTNGGTISWRQLDNRVAVTWSEIPEYPSTGQNSFQIELFFDGRIRITHLVVDSTGGIVGISAGTGVPSDYQETDLSAQSNCAASIAFKRGSYSCSDTVDVVISGASLTGSGPLSIALTSDAGDSETLSATEDPGGAGVFSADISSVAGTPVVSSGSLEVANGDSLTATYDSGFGSPSEIEDTANVDCLDPVISRLSVEQIDGSSERILFETSEASSIRLLYGTSCGSLTGEIEIAEPATVHSVEVTGLSSDVEYFFSIEASDEAGNSRVDDNNGACNTFTTLASGDYFSELFAASDQDFSSKSITFTPDAGENGYTACIVDEASFPTDTAGATAITLLDDDSSLVSLDSGAEVLLYGENYNSFYVGSNGYLTFGSSDDTYLESLESHFGIARISGLFDDLNPTTTGTVSWKQTSDRVAVTWEGVPEFQAVGSNSFQIELFFDGMIRITYLAVSASDGLIGLSGGNGLPGDFVESDFASYGACGVSVPTLGTPGLGSLVLAMLAVALSGGLSARRRRNS